MGPTRGTVPQPSLPPRGSTCPACPTQAPPCLGQEGTPKPPQSVDFPEVAPEPLLFIRTPPPMHTQQSRGRGQPSCPPATSGCHVGAQPVWASVPLSGEWPIVIHVLDCGEENGAHFVEAFQWCTGEL